MNINENEGLSQNSEANEDFAKKENNIEHNNEKNLETTKDNSQPQPSNILDKHLTRNILTRIRRMPEPKSLRGKILGLLLLINIPLIFRPIAEIILGVMICIYVIHNGDVIQINIIDTLPMSKILLVLVISILLYIFSNILNNIVQLKNDRDLYRHKPLVNQSVNLAMAWILCLLAFSGALSIGWTIGGGTFLVILALVFSLILFNIFSRKDRYPAAIIFALASILNIYLGASAIIKVPEDIISIFDSSIDEIIIKEVLIFFPVSIGLYLLGIMLVSTLEDLKPSLFKLSVANFLTLVGLIVPFGYKYVKVYSEGIIITEFLTVEFLTPMFLTAALLIVLVIVMTIAAYENSPRNLHRIVFVGNIGVVWLCAAAIASLDFTFASLVIALLSVPAIMLYLQTPDPAKRRRVYSH